jgi:hypothetical protein
MGLNGEEMRRLERDMRLLTVVTEDLLPVEEGEEDRGVDKSEPEDEWFDAIGESVKEERVRWKLLGGVFMICKTGVRVGPYLVSTSWR